MGTSGTAQPADSQELRRKKRRTVAEEDVDNRDAEVDEDRSAKAVLEEGGDKAADEGGDEVAGEDEVAPEGEDAPRRGRASSDIWAYFVSGAKAHRCRLCKKEVPKEREGTGSLRHHLTGKTKNGHHAFSKEDIATRQGLDTPIEAAPSIAGLALPKAAKEALDRLFVEEAVLRDGRVQCLGDPKYGEGLRTFLRSLLQRCGATHGYEPPAAMQASRLMSQLDKEGDQRLGKELADLNGTAGKGAVMTDGWTEPDGTHHLGLFTVWIPADWILRV